MKEAEIALDSVAPYNFFLSTRLFAARNSTAKDCFRVALRPGGKAALISVTDQGSVNHPEVRMRARAMHSLTNVQIKEAKTLTESILNLSLDLLPFYRYVSDDSVLGPFTDALRGLKPRKTPTVFEALVRAILEQQISLVAAYHLQDKLIRAYGERLPLEEETFFLFPTPEQLSRGTEEDLRACGLSRNKASYILDIAREVAAGSFRVEDLAKEKNTEVILSVLTEVRGVGTWTAEMVMLRGIGRYEAFPAEDLGLRKALSHFYHAGEVFMDIEEARQRAEPWGPWKGLAGFYLIAAELSGLGPGHMSGP
jgi:DNA-3-methyladenine glycosylase II